MANLNKEWTVKISLRSNTPVVGVEIEPFVQVSYKGTCVNLPPYNLSFIWHREKYSCSVHNSKLATVQCMSCVKLKVPVKESFHCSPDCFLKAWKDHLAHHRSASADNVNASSVDGQGKVLQRTSGSWPSFVDGLLENESVVSEQEKIWVKVGCTRRYAPSMGDLRFQLRLDCVAVDKSTGKLLCEPDILVTEPVIITPPPHPRNMIKLHTFGNLNVEDTSDGASFTVLTYNILADLYTRGSGNSCPNWALLWDYRRENLLNEIIGYGADIICLQEVQSDHFKNFFEPQLTKYGYAVSYKKKKRELYTNNKFVSDGCATFYRHDNFRVITTHELEFDNEAQLLIKKMNIGQTNSEKNPSVRLMKGNIALILVLGRVSKGKFQDGVQDKICVANTHIFSDKRFPDVKLFQVSTLVKALEKIAPPSMPLLICADMNSLPASDVHQFVTCGKLDDCHTQTNSNPPGIYNHLKLEHSLNLASAYASFFCSVGVEEELKKMDHKTSEPLFTNFTSTFSGTLDYIFFTEDKLRVLSLLELLDRESIGSSLPTSIWSSDHIALMAKFKILSPPSLKSGTLVPHPNIKQEPDTK